jgi:hypothetical protein
MSGADGGADAEGVGARTAKRVPIDDREAQMVAQGFALDDFSRVVMFEGQRVFGFRPFVFDFLNVFKCHSHKLDLKRNGPVVTKQPLPSKGNGCSLNPTNPNQLFLRRRTMNPTSEPRPSNAIEVGSGTV